MRILHQAEMGRASVNHKSPNLEGKPAKPAILLLTPHYIYCNK